jgi:hypothetical protein
MMEKASQAAQKIAADIDGMIKVAREHKLETLLYVLETAKIEALRATRPEAPKGLGTSPGVAP